MTFFGVGEPTLTSKIRLWNRSLEIFTEIPGRVPFYERLKFSYIFEFSYILLKNENRVCNLIGPSTVLR